MPKRPDINPQAFSRSGGASAPSISTVTPSIRSAPSVGAFAADSVADTFVNMADDAKRLEAIKSNEFDFNLNQTNQAFDDIRSAQMMEAEKELNKLIVDGSAAIEDAKLNSDIHNVAADSIKAYDQSRVNIIDKANLSSFQREYLSPKLDDMRTAVAKNSATYQTQLRRQDQEDTLKETLRTREILAARNPGEVGTLVDEIKQLTEDLGNELTPQEKKRFVEGSARTLRGAALSAKLKANPEAILAELKAGEFDEFFTLNEIQTYSSDAQHLLDARLSAQDKVLKETQSKNDSLVAVAIDTADAVDLPAQSDLDKMRDSNAISFEDWEKNSKALQTRKEADIEKNGSIELGFQIMRSGDIVNPNDSKSVKAYNSAYELAKANIDSLPTPQRVDANMDLIRTNRYVPSLLEGDIETAATSGDPEQVKFAVDMMRVLSSDPSTQYLANNVVDGKARQRLEYINEQLQAGTQTFQEAVTAADQRLSILGKPNVEAANEELKSINKKMDYRADVRKAFSSIADILPGEQFTTDGLGASQLDKATNVYRMAFEDAYLDTRDVKIARQRAQEKLQGRFTRTGINGTDEIMEYGPESYYGVQGDENEWMREQLLGGAKELLGDGMVDPEILDNLSDNIRLVPNAIFTPASEGAETTQYDIMMNTPTGPVRLTSDDNMFTFSSAQRREDLRQAAVSKQEKVDKLREELTSLREEKGPLSLSVQKLEGKLREAIKDTGAKPKFKLGVQF